MGKTKSSFETSPFWKSLLKVNAVIGKSVKKPILYKVPIKYCFEAVWVTLKVYISFTAI